MCEVSLPCFLSNLAYNLADRYVCMFCFGKKENGNQLVRRMPKDTKRQRDAESDLGLF